MDGDYDPYISMEPGGDRFKTFLPETYITPTTIRFIRPGLGANSDKALDRKFTECIGVYWVFSLSLITLTM